MAAAPPPSKPTQAQVAARKAATIARAFSTPEGEAALQILTDEFDGDSVMVPGQPDTTHYNLGRRDVVVFIRQLIRFYKKGNP